MARAVNSPDNSLTLPDAPAVIKTTFEMIAEKGLGKTRLSAVATRLGTPLPALFDAYGSVQSIIDLFLDRIDRHVIHSYANTETPKRDLYFDMLMNRFDELQTHRAGVTRWLKDLAKHPKLSAHLLKRWDKTLSLMLDLGQDSPVFIVKKLGLAAIYAYCLREWMRDETEDMSKTMAAVDRALGRADDFVARYLSPKKKTA